MLGILTQSLPGPWRSNKLQYTVHSAVMIRPHFSQREFYYQLTSCISVCFLSWLSCYSILPLLRCEWASNCTYIVLQLESLEVLGELKVRVRAVSLFFYSYSPTGQCLSIQTVCECSQLFHHRVLLAPINQCGFIIVYVLSLVKSTQQITVYSIKYQS